MAINYKDPLYIEKLMVKQYQKDKKSGQIKKYDADELRAISRACAKIINSKIIFHEEFNILPIASNKLQ